MVASRKHFTAVICGLGFITGIGVSPVEAACPNSSGDPLIQCALPKTPCDPVGSYQQFPGVAPSGQNCGGAVTRFQAGPVSLAYSSMNRERGAGNPLLSSQGFGRGVTTGTWITIVSPTELDLYDSSGSSLRFAKMGTGNLYRAQDFLRGNVTQIELSAYGNVFTLRDPRQAALTEFVKAANSERYLPTRITRDDGWDTLITYDTNGLPTRIRDAKSNRSITFETGPSGNVEKILNSDGVVTRLVYDAEGYLKEIVRADGAKTTIEYDKAGRRFIVGIGNPDLTYQANSYFDNGVLRSTSVGFFDSGRSQVTLSSKTTYDYSADQVISTERNVSTDAPVSFTRVEFTPIGTVGKLATAVFAADGGYDPTSNPGIRLSSSTFGEFGQLVATYDKFGVGTRYFYAASSDCQASGSEPPASVLPTCIKNQQGTATLRYNSKMQVERISLLNARGAVAYTTTLQYNDKGNPTREEVRNARNALVNETWISYDSNGNTPTNITTRTVQTAAYDSLFRPKEIATSSGSILSYGYGADGRVSTVSVNGDAQSISTSVSAGATMRTVSDAVMTKTIQTSADGLGWGFTAQRKSPSTNRLPGIDGMWGGLNADKSARAGFDLSRLQRLDDKESSPTDVSEASQLIPSGVLEQLTDISTIVPTSGVTTIREHQLIDQGMRLANKTRTESLWRKVVSPPSVGAKKKRRVSSVSYKSVAKKAPSK